MRHPSSLYEQYLALAEGEPAQLIDGTIVLAPRPGVAHQRVAIRIVADLQTKFGTKAGGWVILYEPELHFGKPDTDDFAALSPDIVGWRRAKLPSGELPDTAAVDIVPDFVCEVLSTSTRHVDLKQKMPRYAREGVGHAWIVEPTGDGGELQVLRLVDGKYVCVERLRPTERPAHLEPFSEGELVPGSWWER